MQSPACLHCGAPIPRGADVDPGLSQDTEGGGAFCCSGCKVARALLEGHGLDRYYALAGEAPLPAGQEPSERLWLSSLIEGNHGERLVLDVQGITCAACVWVIEKLGDRQGLACQVNPGVGRVELATPRGAEDKRRLDAFLDDVEAVGYRLGPPRKEADAGADDLLVRTGISAALAMNAMIFAFSRYFGLDDVADAQVARWFRMGELVIATASVLVGGTWFFRSAGRALHKGLVHLDLPIAVGVALAYGGSVLSYALSGSDAAYFDTVSMFVALMLLGRLAQRRLLAHSRLLLLADEGLDDLFVRRLEDGRIHTVPASAVRAGDRLLVSPRDVVPMAARVTAGTAPMSFAWITGESDLHEVRPGDEVPAGAHHAGTRACEVVATEDMAASGLHALLRARSGSDEEGSSFWRRYSTVSVGAVLGLAALAGLGWWHAGAVRALEVTTAVLVVTCPCAIGLALPLAGELAAARLRRLGVYVRRAGFLERLLGVRHVVFDKTGTLTMAEPSLNEVSDHALARLPEEDRQALYDLVARSSHPKSRAVASALLARTPLHLSSHVQDVEEIPGQGLKSVTLDASLLRDVFVRRGRTLVRLHFVERLQRDAIEEVHALVGRGLRVHLASGDTAPRVLDTAVRLRLPADHVHASLSPQDKAALVEKLGARTVLVVGDGVNDAPAFAAAACAGTPALDRPQLPARADFVFVGRGIGPLHEVFQTAHRLRRAHLAALGFALTYNAFAVSLALAGQMTPLLCALLMPGSSLVVVTLVSMLMRDRTPSLNAAPLSLKEVSVP